MNRRLMVHLMQMPRPLEGSDFHSALAANMHVSPRLSIVEHDRAVHHPPRRRVDETYHRFFMHMWHEWRDSKIISRPRGLAC